MQSSTTPKKKAVSRSSESRSRSASPKRPKPPRKICAKVKIIDDHHHGYTLASMWCESTDKEKDEPSDEDDDDDSSSGDEMAFYIDAPKTDGLYKVALMFFKDDCDMYGCQEDADLFDNVTSGEEAMALLKEICAWVTVPDGYRDQPGDWDDEGVSYTEDTLCTIDECSIAIPVKHVRLFTEKINEDWIFDNDICIVYTMKREGDLLDYEAFHRSCYEPFRECDSGDALLKL